MYIVSKSDLISICNGHTNTYSVTFLLLCVSFGSFVRVLDIVEHLVSFIVSVVHFTLSFDGLSTFLLTNCHVVGARLSFRAESAHG